MIPELKALLVSMLAALTDQPYPEDGICTHHGVSRAIRINGLDFSVGLAASERPHVRNPDKLLIKIYHSTYKNGDPVRIGAELDRKIASTIGEVAPILEKWNTGGDGVGGSYIIDLPVPAPLVTGVTNYRALKDCFKLSKAESARFSSWDAVFDAACPRVELEPLPEEPEPEPTHFVSASTEGETCRCGQPARHKIGEEIAHDDPNPNRHNLTAYLCCGCYTRVLGPATGCPVLPVETR